MGYWRTERNWYCLQLHTPNLVVGFIFRPEHSARSVATLRAHVSIYQMLLPGREGSTYLQESVDEVVWQSCLRILFRTEVLEDV
jgi:hypothetical protein